MAEPPAEPSSGDLRKLQALEARITSTNETLAEVRARRDQFRSEAVDARRQLREAQRNARDGDRRRVDLEKQVTDLVAENARLAEERDLLSGDVPRLEQKTAGLEAENAKLRQQLADTSAKLEQATRQAKEAASGQQRLEKQVSRMGQQLEGKAPPELAPDQLSHVVGEFISELSSQTGMRVAGSQLKLRVGVNGRDGGSFVLPTAGGDQTKIGELHDIVLNLTPSIDDD